MARTVSIPQRYPNSKTTVMSEELFESFVSIPQRYPDSAFQRGDLCLQLRCVDSSEVSRFPFEGDRSIEMRFQGVDSSEVSRFHEK